MLVLAAAPGTGTIGINAFSLIDLLALIISSHVMLVFFYRYARTTRKQTDRLFAFLMLVVWCQVLLVLLADNIIPSGVAAVSVPNAAERTLFLYRMMYGNGALLMAAILHFGLRYTESFHLPGWRVAWLYVAALATIPLCLSDKFLVMRASPLQETSDWTCAVPWQPLAGPLTIVFGVLWLAVNIFVQRLLWRHSRAPHRGFFDIHTNVVWWGLTLWGLGGLAQLVLGTLDYAGVDPGIFVQTASMVVLAIGLAEEHHRSEQERKHVTRRFQSYVDPALVKYVIEHPETEHIDGEVRELTVVFTDLEGFTALTEKLREGAVSLLNEYLKLMVPLIRDHNGYRNKFLGDGMMFFYGAPERNPDHAIHAVATVLKMQEMMAVFNEALADRRRHLCGDLPRLTMRTGVSSGQMIVGDAGPQDASDYTVLGDTVNLGARLEAANKHMGTRILLSERTVELVPKDLFLLQPIGRLQVVGSARAVMTYQPLAQWNQATEQNKKTAALAHAMVEHFIESDFTRCLNAVNEFERELGPSKLTTLYRGLSEKYLLKNPGPDFSGQIVLSEK